MQTLSYRHGAAAQRQGVDITISLPPGEADAISGDPLEDWFDSALWALSLLRTGINHRAPLPGGPGTLTADTWARVISDLDHRLLPRLEGIRDAAIRRHAEAGGTIGDLALAMDTARSTAQSRRAAVLTGRDRPSVWERWAEAGGPQSLTVAPGLYTLTPGPLPEGPDGWTLTGPGLDADTAPTHPSWASDEDTDAAEARAWAERTIGRRGLPWDVVTGRFGLTTWIATVSAVAG
ncbi:hypothetical protein ACN20G_37145 (plasmid) [Streptomyces sp. BI20]|uniref:hypothetical protein n=1 Tax=Streptomyces sp. BI20 TaxID=3403460 RepID=UPI003C774604